MKKILLALSLAFITLPNTAWSTGESCNTLLNLGLYNVSQSSSATDAQSMAMSTFCSYDYSRSDLSSGQSAAIEGSYGIFSAGASGSASKSEIIEKQSSVCASGFGSSKYSNTASAFSRTVYQGTLDAWNKCQSLANKGLVFEVQPSSTLQGVSVIMTAPTGLAAKFLGVSQFGVGHSDCTTSVNGKLVNVGPSTPLKMTAASKVTVNCTRKMETIGQDLIADAQDLAFVTSADTLTVPLAAIGSLARATVDQVKADVGTDIQNAVNQVKSDTQSAINTLSSILPHGVTRTLGTVYQNKTGKTMYVSVATSNNITTGTTVFYSDSTPNPSLVVSEQSGGKAWARNSFFIVPPNYYYWGKTDNGGSAFSWVEWY